MPSQCATANFLGMERFVGATTGRFENGLKSKKGRRPVFKLMMRDSMNLQYTVSPTYRWNRILYRQNPTTCSSVQLVSLQGEK